MRAPCPLLLLSALLLSTSSSGTAAPPPPKDDIQIIGVVPAGAVEAQVETTFTFEVDVTLETADEAWLNLGFNDGANSTSFRMVSEFLLRKGVERVKISATVRPKDWGRNGEFSALLNIGPRKQGSSYRPSASVRHVIPVLP